MRNALMLITVGRYCCSWPLVAIHPSPPPSSSSESTLPSFIEEESFHGFDDDVVNNPTSPVLGRGFSKPDILDVSVAYDNINYSSDDGEDPVAVLSNIGEPIGHNA